LNLEDKLLKVIYKTPNSNEIGQLAESLESESQFSLDNDIEKLRGIWELRWSSSKAPFLKYSPLIDNLQILDPYSLKGMNLLKPKGINKIIGSAILANLEKINKTRIEVIFTHAGLIGPKLFNYEIKGLLKIKKVQKGWLDITYLNNDIRVCRGDKGTLFVLLKKKNAELYDSFINFNKSFKENLIQ
tara:strand:+ start:85 stop:645 length:561 start_codon:yes stop_codon:yes gene_type:complete